MAISQYKVINPVGPVALSDTATVQQFPLGFKVDAVKIGSASNDSGGYGRFMYAQGSNVASAGQFVNIFNGSAVLLASGNSSSFGPIGVAAGVLSATNAYGWVQMEGYVDYYRHTNVAGAVNIPIYYGSTAGQIGTVSVTGSRIEGIFVPNSWTSSQSASVTLYLDGAVRVRGITANN
ncbi:MAG: hypothetical protein RJA59_319 [Pseudomonadota bacterium]|jgi:hypothetical protein